MLNRLLSKNIEEPWSFIHKRKQCSVTKNSLSTNLPNASSKIASTKLKLIKYRQSTSRPEKT